jgi:nucleoside-diphosphate-sugar epimerase
MSGGEQLIDLVYINDVIDAYLHAADLIQRDSGNGHATYAVSSGSPLKLRDLVSEYCRITGMKIEIKWGARPYRPREVMVPWSTGVAMPGWSPKVALEEGLQMMGQALRSDSDGSMGVPN